MQKSFIALPEIKLIGFTARTNNTKEMDPSSAKIGATIQRYFHKAATTAIPQHKNPTVTFSAYTAYENDFTGDYTYFYGTEVSSFDSLPEGLETLVIPAQTYVRFTTGPGTMPDIVIGAWQQIWQMDAIQLGGIRSYIADFEMYDERASDPTNSIVDLYIGIRK